MSDVLELVAAEVGERHPPAADLEARGTHEERVQAGDRRFADMPLGPQLLEPAQRLVVERAGAPGWLEGRRPARRDLQPETLTRPQRAGCSATGERG